jgi:hypothetical protein
VVADARRGHLSRPPAMVAHLAGPLVLELRVLEFGFAKLRFAELCVFELLRVSLEFEFAA